MSSCHLHPSSGDSTSSLSFPPGFPAPKLFLNCSEQTCIGVFPITSVDSRLLHSTVEKLGLNGKNIQKILFFSLFLGSRRRAFISSTAIMAAMSVIAVSRDDCTKCGVCVNVCPAFIISMGKGDFPGVAEEKEKLCMRCGHCEVFCPFDALKVDFKGVYPTNFNPKAPDIKPDQFGKFMQSRRSIRQFRKKPVDPRVLDDVMETVRFAPTAANRQKVHYVIIMDTEKVRRISALAIEWMRKKMAKQPDHQYADIFNAMIEAYDQGIDLVCRDAPHIIFAAVPTNNPFAVTDAAIALTWFELVAKAYGVGSCWLGTLKLAAEDYPPIQEELRIPEGYIPNYALIFGLPKLRSTGVPKRNPLSVQYI